jgi:GNAT superfamily N-acetyltransferase
MTQEIEIIVSIAEEKDIPEISKRFDEYRQLNGKLSDVDAASKYVKEIKNKGNIILVGYVKEGGIDYLAGFANIFSAYNSIILGVQWVLQDLYVMPKYRKLGLGQAMVEKIVDLVNDNRINRFITEVDSEDNVLKRLLEKSGLEQYEEKVVYIFNRS